MKLIIPQLTEPLLISKIGLLIDSFFDNIDKNELKPDFNVVLNSDYFLISTMVESRKNCLIKPRN